MWIVCQWQLPAWPGRKSQAAKQLGSAKACRLFGASSFSLPGPRNFPRARWIEMVVRETKSLREGGEGTGLPPSCSVVHGAPSPKSLLRTKSFRCHGADRSDRSIDPWKIRNCIKRTPPGTDLSGETGLPTSPDSSGRLRDRQAEMGVKNSKERSKCIATGNKCTTSTRTLQGVPCLEAYR